MPNKCPVCTTDLGFEAWSRGGASFEICPGCGIQFGYNDARPDLRLLVYLCWREEWLTNGRKPFTGSAWSEVSKRVAARALSRVSAG
jgi:hypothetical protein